MKKIKLNLQNFGESEVLTRAQLRNIFGGTSIDPISTTTASEDCPVGQIRCTATDGSGVSVCTYAAPNGGCPTSGLSGCTTHCQTSQGTTIGCYFDANVDSCRCLDANRPCS